MELVPREPESLVGCESASVSGSSAKSVAVGDVLHSVRRKRGAVVTRARELVRFARQHGYGREDLVRIIERVS
jgi:hypothetical protein